MTENVAKMRKRLAEEAAIRTATLLEAAVSELQALTDLQRVAEREADWQSRPVTVGPVVSVFGREDPRVTAERVLANMDPLQPKIVEIPESSYRLDKTPAGYHFTEIPSGAPGHADAIQETIHRMVEEDRLAQANLPALPSGYHWEREFSPTEYDFDSYKAEFTVRYVVKENR